MQKNGAEIANAQTAGRQLVAEIAGLAGAGKTTLLRALCQRNRRILPGLRLRKAQYAPFLIEHCFHWLPTFISHAAHSRWFTWNELRSMVYLHAWQKRLQRPAANGGIAEVVTIFDHGPIFRLAQLLEFGPEMAKSERYRRWWNSQLEHWAEILNFVIWLDAPDAILMQRINQRGRSHRVKQQSLQEGQKFLARYRDVYGQIMRRLAACHGPTMFAIDTSREPLDQIVEKVLHVLDTESNIA